MTADRREILRDNDLAVAPRWRQVLFWQQYNRARRRRGATANLAEVAEQLLSIQGLRSARRLYRMEQAWREVVPAPCSSRSCVETFSQGKLVVGVDSAATRFYLSRQAGADLVEQLNACLGEPAVNRVEYRVRAAAQEVSRRQSGASKQSRRA